MPPDGFASADGFRRAVAQVLGRPPPDATGGTLLRAGCIASPLGPLLAVASARTLHLLEFFARKALPAELRRLERMGRSEIGLGRFGVHDQAEAELRRYFAGDVRPFATPLGLPAGSAFNAAVWGALRAIPAGQTRSYGGLAEALGRPAAARAVARANGANPIAILVPCHRVVGADGDLTGYGGGLWRKRWLLDHERAAAQLPR